MRGGDSATAVERLHIWARRTKGMNACDAAIRLSGVRLRNWSEERAGPDVGHEVGVLLGGVAGVGEQLEVLR